MGKDREAGMEQKIYDTVETEVLPSVELAGSSLVKLDGLTCGQAVRVIRTLLQRSKESFLKIGYCLKKIRDSGMYREEGYDSIYGFAQDKFDLARSTTARFIAICEKFTVNGNSDIPEERFRGFSMSQYFEMLPMDPEDWDRITPEMNVREIKQVKKDIMERKKTSVGGDSSLSDPGRHTVPRMREKAVQPKLPETVILPEIPKCKSAAERRRWLDNIDNWGFWYEDPNIGARYYRVMNEKGRILIRTMYRYTCPFFDWETRMTNSEQIARRERDGTYTLDAGVSFIEE